MRLHFKKGKQKKMLKGEKEILNLTWVKFADYLGLKYGKLLAFVNEEVYIDDITFNKLKLRKEYDKFIIEKMDEGWGRVKAGKISLGRTKLIKIPKKSKELAELWGVTLGDGHVQKIKRYKVGSYQVKIAGHSIDDFDYLTNYVKPLIENLFEVKARLYFSKRSNCMFVIVDSRKIVDFFEKNGFKAGNKIVNQVTICDWIKENPLFLAACLRGLYDTDGSFYKLTNQNSYQVHFKNSNLRLLEDLREGLINLGLGPSKIMKNGSIVITKKSEIEKFYKVIGFSNSKHLNKIKKFFRAP